jgi:UDP-glucose 4-epimerase
MTIVGDGKQRRDFTHVSDIVKANILAMESEDIAGVSGEIFNVGTGTNHSMLEIASMIGDKVEHLPPRLGEAQETLADISKISHYFGYQPSVAVEDWISKNK